MSSELELKFFRFKCNSISRTIDFWDTALKMQQMRQSEGTRDRCCVHYPGDSVGLRFELQSQSSQHTASSSSSSRRHGERKKSSARTVATVPVGDVTVLVYVDRLEDFVHRVRDGGFTVYLEPYSVQPGVRAAVLVDPTGLKVRLIESEFSPFRSTMSHGRLGYVSVPVSDYSSIERAVAFYETTFRASSTVTTSNQTTSPRSRRPGSSSSVGSRRSSDYRRSSTPGVSLLGASVSGTAGGRAPSSLANSPVKKRQSFRLVDVERFVEDLTTYIWMGNGPRSSHPSLCLLHKTIRRAPNLAHSGHSSHSHHNMTIPATSGVTGTSVNASSGTFAAMSPNGGLSPSSPATNGPHFLFPPGSSANVPPSPGGDSTSSTPVPLSPTLSAAGSTSSLAIPSPSSSSTPRGVAPSSPSAMPTATDIRPSHAGRPNDQLFLGLAMAVPDLDQCLRALRDAPAGITHSRLGLEIQSALTPTHASGASATAASSTNNVPRYISLYDPALVPVEITDGVLNLALNMAAITAASATVAAGFGLLSAAAAPSMVSSLSATFGSPTRTSVVASTPSPSMAHRPRPPSSNRRTEVGLPQFL